MSLYFCNNKGKVDFHFIVAPPSPVLDVWVEQYESFSTIKTCEDFPENWKPTVLIGSRKERLRLLYDADSGPVFVINYEGLSVIEDEKF